MLAPVTLDYSIRLHYETEPGTAFVFALLPARTHRQQLAMELLRVHGAIAQSVFTDAASATRYLHVAARGGSLHLELNAQVRLLQAELGERSLHRDTHTAPLASPESLRYLLPSRYCPSDRLAALAAREFLDFEPAYERAVAIEAWVRRHVRALPPDGSVPGLNVTDAADAPNAVDVLGRGAGTPRDLAHLTIALCRASRLAARYVTTVPLETDGARDLHPWVEVLVEDAWLAFDPSRRVPRTALLRLGTGRDGADVPLAIAHGAVHDARVEWSFGCPGTTVETLVERDREAGAILSATLGSLGEATRWHQEARLAARRRATETLEPDDASRRPSPSRVAAAAARAATTTPRRDAQVLMFPGPATPRAASSTRGPRFEPI